MNRQMTRQIDGHPYKDRDTRNQFIAENFKSYIGKTVLNIGGGGEHFLKKYLSQEINYFELDIAGQPDLKINLEKDLPLPIDNAQYDTVICTDVLEHVDNLHLVFDELVRVSSKYLIISLPNAVTDVLAYFKDKPYRGNTLEQKTKYGKYMKFYGLPLEKPLDRHKWFFSYSDAEEFLFYKACKLNVEITELFGLNYHSPKITGKFVRILVKNFLGETALRNIFCSVLWCVIKVDHKKIS
jgi:2-polyprenyl-3-methyl-5-hydroxy-6-metoxy-1,4-benzoquinol methylase